VIGYALAPGASVITRKKCLVFFQSAAEAAAWKVSALGLTKLPALFWTTPKEILSIFCKAYAYSRYPIEPGIEAISEATPSLPLPPTPCGHSSEVLSPTVAFHSELIFER